MQFSEYWLRSMVNPRLDTGALEHLLTMSGLEVEEMNPVAAAFEGIVVGHVLETAPHPDADKLRVCRVDVGEGEPLQIVCGAPNVAPGMKVPCARIGARLPGLDIKRAKLRGVESFGMLCSARELGISEDHGGLLALPADAPVGQSVRELLALDDTLFTIKLTPNRADCLSILGVAREVSALTGAQLCAPHIDPVAPTSDARRGVQLEAPQGCPRYLGRVFRGVDATRPTPEWMKQRLLRSGIRSISALVDITNYVMLELGQPLHVFDDAKLSGDIRVRWSRPGERIELLNEQLLDINADTLLITDDSGPLAMAGVMGGEHSGVTLQTRDVFLESAFFAPDAIAGRARAYGFSSDASHRFERGVDFELPARAMERASALILEICGGSVGPVTEAVVAEALPARKPVSVRPDRVRRLLGFELSDQRIVELLAGVHLQVQPAADGQLLVTPPSFRFDIEIEEDIVEEVARLYGYDNIPAPAPRGALEMAPVSESSRPSWALRHQLADLDYQEVVNFAFVEEAWERDFCANDAAIRLANPIASQMSVMRSSLIGGLIANVQTNRKRQNPRVRVFELGRCFSRAAEGRPVAGYQQPRRLAALAAGPVWAEQWGGVTRNVDFFDLKGDLEALLAPRRAEFVKAEHPALHPGRSAQVLVDGQVAGIIGEVHPRWVQAYDLGTAPVVFEMDLEVLLSTGKPEAGEISRMPVVSRDLALVVSREVESAALLQAMRAAAPAIVQSLEVFDLYQGKGVEEGKKSLAFRVLMQDTQRTLEDAEVDAAMEAITAAARERFAASLR